MITAEHSGGEGVEWMCKCKKGTFYTVATGILQVEASSVIAVGGGGAGEKRKKEKLIITNFRSA